MKNLRFLQRRAKQEKLRKYTSRVAVRFANKLLLEPASEKPAVRPMVFGHISAFFIAN